MPVILSLIHQPTVFPWQKSEYNGIVLFQAPTLSPVFVLLVLTIIDTTPVGEKWSCRTTRMFHLSICKSDEMITEADRGQILSCDCSISYNTPLGTEMCTSILEMEVLLYIYALLKWCNVGYGTMASWDLWNCSLPPVVSCQTLCCHSIDPCNIAFSSINHNFCVSILKH